MKNTKLAFIGALLALTLNSFGALVFDGTVTVLQNTSEYSYGNGGEFKAITSGLGTFQTFCMEESENFSPGATYRYIVNTGAVRGGNGAHAIDPNTGNSMDNVSIGTAWLYSQFRANTLSGYNYANRLSSSGDLQNAIWWLEDEGGAYNSYVRLAELALGMNSNTIKSDSHGAYGVMALNIYDNNGGFIQDQLTVVPEPATLLAGALLLLPFGVSSLRVIRIKNTFTGLN